MALAMLDHCRAPYRLVAVLSLLLAGLTLRSAHALKVNGQWTLQDSFSVACYTGVTVTNKDVTGWDLLDWNDPANDAVSTHHLAECNHPGADTSKHTYKRVVLQGKVQHTRFSFPALKRQFRDTLLICPQLGQGQRVDLDPDPGVPSKLQPFKCEDTITDSPPEALPAAAVVAESH